jgi:hypothetical protein
VLGLVRVLLLAAADGRLRPVAVVAAGREHQAPRARREQRAHVLAGGVRAADRGEAGEGEQQEQPEGEGEVVEVVGAEEEAARTRRGRESREEERKEISALLRR